MDLAEVELGELPRKPLEPHHHTGGRRPPHPPDQRVDRGLASAVALASQPVQDLHRGQVSPLVEPTLDRRLVRHHLARAAHPARGLRRAANERLHRLLLRDAAHAPPRNLRPLRYLSLGQSLPQEDLYLVSLDHRDHLVRLRSRVRP
jgi:hypothetical protein